jgi:biuret amidohydrolase
MMQQAFGLSIPVTLEDVCDPTRTALLVYDMQVGIVGRLPGGAEFIQSVKAVLEAARKARVRVFFCRHTTLPVEIAGVAQLKSMMALTRTQDANKVRPNFLPGSPPHAVIPDLEPLASEAVFDKLAMSAFTGTYLDYALRDARVETLALVGAVLEIGIEPTIRQGFDLGYQTVLIEDACYSLSLENQQSVLKSLARIGFTTNSQTFIELLNK